MHARKRFLVGIVDVVLFLVFPWRLRYFRCREVLSAKVPRRVLFCRPDHIGDAFLSMPALEFVRARYPDAHLTVLVASWSEPLFRVAGYHDELLVCDLPWWVSKRKARFGPVGTSDSWRALWHTILALRARRFDLCIELRGDVRQIVAFGLLGGASLLLTRRRNGGAALADAVPKIDERLHECDQNLALVSELGPRLTVSTFPMPYAAADRECVRILLEEMHANLNMRYVVVHPGAKWVNRWPEEAYAELIKGLGEYPGALRVLITGVPAEAGLCERLAAALPGRAYSLAGRLSLTEMAALMAVVDLVVMADTGPMHFLNAFSTPALLLFGPTPACRFAPRGPQITVVSAVDCCSEDLHEICSRVGAGTHSACMAGLLPSEVLRIARATLADTALSCSSVMGKN